MTKKVLYAAALFALAFNALALPRVAVVSAQQLASNTPPTVARAAAPARRFLKRMALSVGEAAEGARVRITSDAPIEGYQTYGEGGKFMLLIPEADATTLSTTGLAGRGLSGVEAQQRGDDALISFKTVEGFAPRVRASFNRLEVVFASQQQPVAGGATPSTSNAATPTPTPPASAPLAPAGASTEGMSANTAPATGTTKPAAAAPGTSAARFASMLTPEKSSPVRLTRFDKPPTIDGKLDEDVWKTASTFKDFIQFKPGDLIAPSQPTEAYLGYDAKFIYVAFRAHDEPGKVRATVGKRDAIFDDDWVGVWLDTFNDGRRSYELIFNPFGIQADAIFTEGVNEDFSVDIVMESKGTVTNDGFIVEVAIPFKSLRYEAGKDKLWGVHFLRTIKRFNNEQSSWMPISRDNSSLLGQRGHITGLEGISSERTLEIIPSLTLSQEGRRIRNTTPTGIPGVERFDPASPDRFRNSSFEFDPGVSAKFTITPQITLDFTYNPDFAQVEADATVITANQRFPIFFEEKRPFFLEGKEIFETIISAV
ncbi:MAG: carbohydrate binding family 9 domain-containing protein, partial [Rubrivivax sp.]|nr:carbohydrate binding family 9 domain-containing protein [Pyrinomonadaceae bacterium]